MTVEERHAHWQRIIEGQKTSGKTIAEYCRIRSITSSQFYTWRCKITQRQTDHRGFVELKPSMNNTGIRIYPAENIFIEVSKGFDAATLQAVLAAMGNQ